MTEKKQNQSSGINEEVLRRSLVEVSLVAQGISPELDQNLNALRATLRQQPLMLSSMKKVMAHIESTAEQTERLKEKLTAQTQTNLRAMGEKLLIEADKSEPIRQWLKDLHNRPHGLLDIPHLIDQLCHFHKEIEDEPAILVARSQAIESLSKVSDHLMKQLSIQPDMKSALAHLAKNVSEPSPSWSLQDYIQLFVRFSIELLHQEQQSFSQYLQVLEKPLDSLEGVLSKQHSLFEEKVEHDRNFHSSLHSELNEIGTDLNTNSDLNNLVSGMRTRISHLQQELENYTRQKEAQEADLIAQQTELQSQLSNIASSQAEAYRQLEQFRKNSLTDTLTQLPNRAALNQRFDEEWQRFKRYKNPMCVAVADVDFFKNINDSHGHLTGDNVLRALATQLKKYLRKSDFIARFGGEEFVLILPETELQDAETALNHLRVKIESSRFFLKSQIIPVTISIGVSQALASDNKELLFARADRALYTAKNNGRNNVVAHTAENIDSDDLKSGQE